MTWIPVTPAAQADEKLRAVYEAIYALYPPDYGSAPPASIPRNDDGTADSITAAHSLIPEAMRHAMSTFGVLLSPDLPLTRRQHEMIATLVSVLNRCFY